MAGEGQPKLVVAHPSRELPALGQRTLDAIVVVSLVVLAAALRFVDLPTRGTWDADQGHDMLVLRALVTDGAIPLLGPPTSIGDFHHGAWYYYLLAPAAFLGGAAPEAVLAAIALAGTAAVAVTWWVARSLGGSLAGAVAGLLMAVSASAIEESTFIWNPNLIALSSSVALAGAWRAWQTGRARWWLLAAVGVVVTMQCHVLGVVLLPPVAGLLLVDARRRPSPTERRSVLAAGLAGLVILGIGYLPLAVHELTSGFAETNAVIAYLREGGEPIALGPLARILFVGLRILAWPLVGLVTDALVAAVAAATLVVVVLAWRARAPGSGRAADTERGTAGTERTAVRWMGLTLAWCTVALAIVAGSLATVTPGLPNDHYHSFLDPIVFVTVGLGAAVLWRSGRAGRSIAVVAVGALVAFNVTHWPPPVASDGGWPAARAAAARIATGTAGREVALVSLPEFKNPDAIGFPLVARGVEVVGPGTSGAVVVVCDSLFEAAIGVPCGGPAEDALVAGSDAFGPLVDRFPASGRTWVSVYLDRGP